VPDHVDGRRIQRTLVVEQGQVGVARPHRDADRLAGQAGGGGTQAAEQRRVDLDAAAARRQPDLDVQPVQAYVVDVRGWGQRHRQHAGR